MGEKSKAQGPPGYCVIMAGGQGTRFWPLSRVSRPKQLLSLTSAKTLLRQTFERLVPLVGSDRIIVVTNATLVAAIANELPELPPSHILGEPKGCNTAPCAALGIGIAERLGGRVPVALLPADHWIPDDAAFHDQLARAFAHAWVTGEAITFGIPPTRPETGYGYLEVVDLEQPAVRTKTDPVANGSPGTDSTGGPDLVAGLRFVEKPDRDTARAYVSSGRHFWNAGIFVWDSQAFGQALQEHLPEVATAMSGAITAFGRGDFPDALSDAYSLCPAVSLDYGVMEHLPAFTVMKAAFRWSDIGSWDEWGNLAGRLAGDNRGNTRLCPLDSRGNVIYAPRKTVALVGVEDLIVVDTDDALLVCRGDAAQRIRDVTERLRELDCQDLL